MRNRSTRKSPFEIVYTKIPCLTVDLTTLPSGTSGSRGNGRAYFQATQGNDHLEASTASYKLQADKHRCSQSFEIGNLVMVHLQKSKLPSDSHGKLQPKKIALFPILERCGPNAYKVDLLPHSKMAPTFNLSDLTVYHASDDFRLAPKTQGQVIFGGRELK